jgi:hypothetical protein
VLPHAKKRFWSIVDAKILNPKQSFQSYGQLKEFINGWVQKKIFRLIHNNYQPCPNILHTKAQL